MFIDKDKVTEIFVLADEFCQEFEKSISKHQIGNRPKRKPQMCTSEVITIMVLFHFGAFKNFKHFYLYYVKEHMINDFPQTVSYNRFVELLQASALPMTLFLKTCCLGKCTGISFIDSTSVDFASNTCWDGIVFLLRNT